MTDSTASRVSTMISSMMLLCVACVLYFGPNFLDEDHPKEIVWVLKIAWVGITGVAFLAPFESFNTWVVMNHESLRKRNLFLRETFLRWSEIRQLELKKDGSEIIFRSDGKRKITVSKRFNGWEDLREYAEKHLDPEAVVGLEEMIMV